MPLPRADESYPRGKIQCCPERPRVQIGWVSAITDEVILAAYARLRESEAIRNAQWQRKRHERHYHPDYYRQRTVMIMQMRGQGYTPKQIAAVAGMSSQAVSHAIQRHKRKRLRALRRERFFEEREETPLNPDMARAWASEWRRWLPAIQELGHGSIHDVLRTDRGDTVGTGADVETIYPRG